MAHTTRLKSALKKFRDRVTHEVPTGPHTDVRRRKINPSFRKKITGMGKPIPKKLPSVKELKASGQVSKKYNKGGRAGFQHGGRTNLYEELGRVEAEPSNRNRRAEISRVHRELNKGYKSGGAVLKGKKVGIQIK